MKILPHRENAKRFIRWRNRQEDGRGRSGHGHERDARGLLRGTPAVDAFLRMSERADADARRFLGAAAYGAAARRAADD